MNREFDSVLEELTRLYLRLNGFINQNLIIHSDVNGESCGELDIIGVRFPFHSQSDREVDTSPILEASKDKIQIIIGDCKNFDKRENLKFSPLRKKKECIEKLFNWIGLQEKCDDKLIENFESCLNVHRKKNFLGFPTINLDTSYAKFDIKFIFFCPSLEEWDGNSFKYVHGQEIFNYTFRCLNKIDSIERCSRTYNYENWNNYQWLIRYFKDRTSAGTIEDFKNDYKKYYR